MSVLPTDTELGKLEITQVLDYYNGPRLFICVNEGGLHYCALWVDEVPQGDEWLYAAVSPSMLVKVQSGQVDIREPFIKPADNALFRVVTFRAGGNAIERIATDRVATDDLPPAGDRVQEAMAPTFSALAAPLPSSIKPYELRLPEKVDAAIMAAATNREIINIALGVESASAEDVPISLVGQVLYNFQRLADAVSQSLYGTPSNRGSVPKRLSWSSQLGLAGVYSGSVGFQLASLRDAEPDVAEETFRELSNLLAVSANKRELLHAAERYSQRALRRYEDLLIDLKRLDASMAFEWASPHVVTSRIAYINAQDTHRLTNLLKEVRREVKTSLVSAVVKLVMINVKSGRFQVDDIRRKRSYRGEIEPRAMRGTASVRFDKPYRVVMRRITTPLGRGTEKYRLVSLERADRVKSTVRE